MKKTSITISIPNNVTQEEIMEIRQLFNANPLSKEYRLNILVSGKDDMKDTLGNFLIEKLKAKL